MSDSANHRTPFGGQRQELLARLLQERGLASAHDQLTPGWPEADEPPLSFAQQRLWFLAQLEPDSPAYNVPVAVRLSGSLNLPALTRGLNEIVRRHDALRTIFPAEGGQPKQVIAPELVVSLPLIDLSRLPEAERSTEARRLAVAEASRPFDLARGPLIRATLVRLAPAEHVALLTLHHIVSDGWSTGVFVRELAALYDAFVAGKWSESPLPDLPIQYADYAYWQHEQFAAEGALQSRLAYWQEKLADAPATLDLPTDHPRSTSPDLRGATHAFALPPALSESIRALSRREGVTSFMTLLAAFQTLLYRYTGQTDLLIGSPVANRDRAELAGLIGFFVNTLVLRGDLSGRPTFRELLKRVRQTCIEVFDLQDLPFEKLVEVLQPERQLNQTPLFQVMFAFQHVQGASETSLSLNGLNLSVMEVSSGTAKFDLTLSLAEAPDGLSGVWEYRTDLFEAATIACLSGHFETLLASIVANPDERISALRLMSAAEEHRLLVEWNATRVDYPRQASIAEVFAAQVARRPDAVALVQPGDDIDRFVTYHELNRRADQLARHLHGLGVKPDACVGLCLARSLDMIIGLLGILKAGGAYLPLDPSYPAERLAFMLDEVYVDVLLTQQALVEQLPVHRARVICLDTDWPSISHSSFSILHSSFSPDSLAYVMYTSGSTGKPKGIAIPQRAVVRLVKGANFAAMSPEEIFLQFAPVSFDAATLEIWGPLLNGGRLVIGPARLPSLDELGRLLEEQCVTTLWLTAGLFHQMVDNNLGSLRRVRRLLAGGDVLSAPHVRRTLAALEGGRLINGYGPTENTTFTCCYPMAATDDIPDAIPIGRPISSTQVYILDADLRPVPIGVPGELCVGGDGLARGYLDSPDLTAEKFVPALVFPPPSETGEGGGGRLYKTGDVARWLPSGAIEFLGRRDQQVKVRGFRIELGEIEAALARHPDVQACAIVARAAIDRQDKRLIAYLVPRQGSALVSGELRRFLQTTLPDYMLPSAFVTLESLPLTPNGKVDRRALPSLDDDRLESIANFVAPRTPIEEVVAGIWIDVLGVKRVGAHDNFFELGGHSLLATQLMSRVREAFRVEVPLRRLFESPTVAGLAEHIEAALRGASGAASPIAPAASAQAGGDLPLSFAQQLLWILDQLEPGNPAYNLPMSVRLSGRLDVAALSKTIEAIAQRHAVLRTTFAVRGGIPVQIIDPVANAPLPLIDLRTLADAAREVEVARLTANMARHRFDLRRGPLLRVELLRLRDDEHIFLGVMHHVVCDGWSIGVLVRELAVLYEAFSSGRASPLPELSIQYADYALWQRRWLQNETLPAQLDYWKRQLAGASTVLHLPTDRPRPPVQTYRGERLNATLPHDLSDALHVFSRRENVTLFMTLLAAFQTVLHRYTGQDDILVGTPVANRTRRETEGLIGLLANNLVLRADFSDNPTFRALLGRVREAALDAYAHQEMPFEKLMEELQPERDLSRTPLFQVLFILQNAPLPPLELRGLRLDLLAADSGAAAFDLTLSLNETEDGLAASFSYNADLFDAATIDRLLHHYQTLLSAIVVQPERRVSELPLLTETERRQLLVEWQSHRAEFPQTHCLHQLFEAQVERAPDAVALVFPETDDERHRDECLTYSELNRRANALAHHLRRFGVEPDAVVGIYLERSPQMIVAILGVLKAGGAYLPLDPAYPAARLSFMLSDARARVLLTQQSLVETLTPHAAQTICLDTDWLFNLQLPTSNIQSPASPDNLAYVIYTSGSTGQPKGVMIPHANAGRLFDATRAWFHFDARDVWTLFHSYAFDFSVWEMWGALLYGGRLAIVPYWVSRSPETFHALLCDAQVTVLNQTPSAFRQLIQADETIGASQRLKLRLVVFGGEALELQSLKPWFERHGDARPQLVNMYGITETTVHVTYRPLTYADALQATGSLIGGSIPDLQLYMLHPDSLEPMPIGVPGELYVGGAGLSRGYLNRPDLTAERFTPNPFTDDCQLLTDRLSVISEQLAVGGRLYKTGDLARRLPGGDIEYLGRIDHQVKLRGFRIELDEIERALAAHPNVRECLVLLRGAEHSAHAEAEAHLVAYVVPRGGSPTHHELYTFLKETLPDYMLPSAFVLLEAMPLTPNGKVDRRALPEPAAMRPDLDRDFTAPRTPLEAELAAIWAQLLGLERVGIFDNFFELGGHSLIATQVLSRVREAFEVDIPLRVIFTGGFTVAELAAIVRHYQLEQVDVDHQALLSELADLSDEEVEALLQSE